MVAPFRSDSVTNPPLTHDRPVKSPVNKDMLQTRSRWCSADCPFAWLVLWATCRQGTNVIATSRGASHRSMQSRKGEDETDSGV